MIASFLDDEIITETVSIVLYSNFRINMDNIETSLERVRSEGM